MTPIKRLLAGAAALAAVATLGATTPATAAADPIAPIAVTRLVLEPTERGYAGTVRITISNTGATPVVPSLAFAEPVAGAWRSITPVAGCETFLDEFAPPASPRSVHCRLDRVLQPGDVVRLTAAFEVLTRPRAYAMSAPDARYVVGPGFGEGDLSGEATSTTRFRSTSGSLANPRPYVQDTQPDATITVAGDVILAAMPGPAGGYKGRVPVTVRWRGDAPHTGISIAAETRPDGVSFVGSNPLSPVCLNAVCEVPGGPMAPGEVRTFDILLGGGDLVPGPLGEMRLVMAVFWPNEVPDVDPTDNAVTFDLTAVR